MELDNMYKSDRWPSIYAEDGSLLLDEEEIVLQNSPDQAPFVSFLDSTTNRPPVEFFNPREKQRTIAKGRDFYITGRFNNLCFPDDAVLVINIYETNNGQQSDKIVRSVFCQAKDDKNHLYIADEYTLLTQFSVRREEKLPQFFKEDVRNSCIPDLVFDKSDDKEILSANFDKSIGPKSLQWTWNKAYYTDTFFSAIIYGGEYGKVIEKSINEYNRKKKHEAEIHGKTFKEYRRPYPYTLDGYMDKNGVCYGSCDPKEITSLEEGEYIVEVSVYDKKVIGTNNPYKFVSKNYIARGSLKIRIGTISDKIMATFSYDDHIKRLREIDSDPQEKKTLMWDPFPGMWIKAIITDDKIMFRPDQKGDFRFGIETDRARTNFNDSVEYRDGTIHFYNYGVMSWSNALTSEFPEVFKQIQAGKKPNIVTYYYENGEPYTYDDKERSQFNGPSENNKSKIKIMDKVVQFLYAEIDKSGKTIQDGINDRYVDNRARKIEKIPVGLFSEKDRVVKPGYRISICGICNLPSDQHYSEHDVQLAYNDSSIWTSFIYECPQNGKNVVKSESLKRTFEKDVQQVFDTEVNGEYQRGIRTVRLVFSKIGVLEFKHVFEVPKEWAGKHIKIVAKAAYASSSQRVQIGTALDGETVLEFDVEM